MEFYKKSNIALKIELAKMSDMVKSNKVFSKSWQMMH